jgi:DNA-binding response OmpR family regulator
MTGKTILLVANDWEVAQAVEDSLRVGGFARLHRVWDVREAAGDIERWKFSAVLYASSAEADLLGLDAVLWARSRSPRDFPIVSICERYEEAQALTALRMGVSDHLSLSDHRAVIPAVLKALLDGTRDDNPQEISSPEAVSTESQTALPALA